MRIRHEPLRCFRTSKKRALPSARPTRTAILAQDSQHPECGSRRLPGPPRPTRDRPSIPAGTLLGKGEGTGSWRATTSDCRRSTRRSSRSRTPAATCTWPWRSFSTRRRSRASHGGLDMERIRGYVESRLHLIPRYRQRLTYIPLERHPVVGRRRPLQPLLSRPPHRPAPSRRGAPAEAPLRPDPLAEARPDQAAVGDLGRRGAGGRPFALVAKAHHAMVDGISGMDLLAVLLSPTPCATYDPGPPWQPRPTPSASELVLGELWRRGTGALAFARAGAQALASPLRSLSAAWERAGGVLEALAPGSVPASPTPLNPCIGPHRRFDWLRLDLDDVKAVKRSLGGTVNDVVLATVVGAARRFLLARGVRLEGLDFRALVPVSVRGADRARTARQPGGELRRPPADRRARSAATLRARRGRDLAAQALARGAGRGASRGARRLDHDRRC